MIEITPAILTNSREELKELLLKYASLGFKSIDIDIQEEGFVSDTTLPYTEAIEVVKELASELEGIVIGWDLKLKRPVGAVTSLTETFPNNIRIYIYTNAEVESIERDGEIIRLGVLGNENLPVSDALDNIPEIQLMTIKEEKQGSTLDPCLLARSMELRTRGFKGVISVDGGVNLDTADLVSLYPIGRVSVGSYLQSSSDVESSYKELEEVFNKDVSKFEVG